ncbi:hypothetical protein EVAR_61507_1 [Eumeta japonica]|uniref:Uncharacterized protein n=1 Tax=Eumeta variegata TaxID=151549 RepID=A0A4C2A715_EUMVA|nr:hypothetical protein EVAR_61507_1 [Eumeta japonica]
MSGREPRQSMRYRCTECMWRSCIKYAKCMATPPQLYISYMCRGMRHLQIAAYMESPHPLRPLKEIFSLCESDTSLCPGTRTAPNGFFSFFPPFRTGRTTKRRKCIHAVVLRSLLVKLVLQ